ncbi:hypothetical protein JOB18_027806 [Solea senegalensis]|uniref:Uncharacterized protein n=1 Tax=Solea senegalensis TaxID=28829 RepID=A0AAV6S3Q4_SOLSE|nr:hypothetical protein JOB18_027806 [Solea senegalensis]
MLQRCSHVALAPVSLGQRLVKSQSSGSRTEHGLHIYIYEGTSANAGAWIVQLKDSLHEEEEEEREGEGERGREFFLGLQWYHHCTETQTYTCHSAEKTLHRCKVRLHQRYEGKEQNKREHVQRCLARHQL